MTTAATLITDTLEYLGLSSYLVAADPEQQKRAFTTIQRLFDMLPAMDVYLPMNRPASTSTNLREPGYSTMALVPILAKKVKPFFKSAAWSMENENEYMEAVNLLQRKTERPLRTSFPDGLPVGQGNYDRYHCDKFFYPGETDYQVTLYDNRNVGEIKTYSHDFTSETTERSTSVSSIEWSNIGGVNAVISGESLADDKADVTLSLNAAGLAVVRARATFADGDKYDAIFNIRVQNPESSYRSADYG